MVKNKNISTAALIICSVAAIFYCYGYMLRIEPTVMARDLRIFFQANATEFGILSASFYFIYAPMQIVVGVLSDIYGPKRILTIAIISCTLGSYIFSIAPNMPIAFVARLLVGFGCSFIFVCALKLAASWLPKRFFALFAGLANGLGMLGGMFGVIVLSSAVKNIGWKQTINMGTIAGAILIPIIWFTIRDKPETTKSHTKTTREQYREIFIGLQKILKNPQMWIIGIIACALYLSLSLFAELWGIPYLTTAYPSHDAATICSMVFLGWLIGGPLIGHISDAAKTRKIPISACCLSSAILACLIIYIPGINIYLLYSLLFLFGTFCSSEILCFAVSRENNSDDLVATAIAFTNTLVMVGGLTTQPLIGKILDATWSGKIIDSTRIYSPENYQIALSVLPIMLFASFILSLRLRETYNKK